MSLIACIVLNRIGQNEAKTASEILISGLVLIAMMASGIRATDGIGRMNSTTMLNAERTSGMLPKMMPTGTASPMAMASDIAHAITDWVTSREKPRSLDSSTNRAPMTVGGGRYAGFTKPERATSSQIASTPTVPAMFRTSRDIRVVNY